MAASDEFATRRRWALRILRGVSETSRAPRYSADDIKRFRANLRDEVDGVALYRRLAEAEKDPHLRQVYEGLSQSEERHLALWRRKLEEAGAPVPDYRPSLRVRLLGWVARRLGTGAVAPIVVQMEAGATTMYDDQPEALEHGLPRDERSHARLFREISRTPAARQGRFDIAAVEGRHRGATGNALRAAVLGANDGLVSNLSLVMGVAGADPGRDVVILSGIAGLLAGSLSMALGEWISVRSSAEAFERQVSIEREELAEMPEEEEEELTLIYQAKGLSASDARSTARQILSNQQTALDTLTREELGMSAEEAGNPWVAAVSSFLMFSAGAILPVLPWLFVGGLAGIAASAAASGLGLFAVGAVISFFTGRDALFSGARMLVFGLAAAAITFGIGYGAGQVWGITTSG
jgi:VIT1/CCC1 family predicted Fe2+/Mn2+ transporter